ncbi:4-hydroxy-tetrahydrodipicolinate synthase [Mycobacterium innocens]|uniref:4-hydroxy-tetrahydrodipicolinate synthase n=1 Tax=Mycobacterium innocens TaxID=2341083 RepID=A0A498QBU6_9MYCO|nr:4-hydroxy-tetrahydrodipicolinate synthase [Mycobacterium innocens]
MATAGEARAWARGALGGIGDSLYTPFCGNDGDDIDWDAYRTLVRYCVGDLGHPMLWCTSGIGEFWSLTIDERKCLLEVAIEEGRRCNPDVLIQACTSAMTAKDCLELTLHAQAAGADIAYIQTPMMETHGGEGVLRFFKYVAARTDIALGMFNSPSSGYVLTPAESARIYHEVPAVCATKEGAFRPQASRLLHELAPGLVLWECDKTIYRAGWLRAGIVCAAQLGTAGYLMETPQRPLLSEYWDLVLGDKLIEAMDYGRDSGLDQFDVTSVRGGPAIRADPTTSPTGVVRSSSRRRCWVCRSGPIRLPGPPRPSCRPRPRLKSRLPIVGWGSSMANRCAAVGSRRHR